MKTLPVLGSLKDIFPLISELVTEVRMVAEDLPVFQVLDCLKERLVTAAKGEKSFTGALYGLQVLLA